MRREVGGPLLRGVGVISGDCGLNEPCVYSVSKPDIYAHAQRETATVTVPAKREGKEREERENAGDRESRASSLLWLDSGRSETVVKVQCGPLVSSINNSIYGYCLH